MPVLTVSAPLPPVVAPATDEAVDAELLEIFLSEAEEVLAAVRQILPASRNEPHNQEHLTTLRRSFHTLKGSSRMVGLVAFGEAAWSIEQVLNLRLSESRGADPELYALLDKAVEILGAWVQDLQQRGRSDRTPHALVNAAARVKAGESFLFEGNEGNATGGEHEGMAQSPVADATNPAVRFEPQSYAPVAVDGFQTAEANDSLDMVDASPALPEVEEIQLSDAELALFGAAENPFPAVTSQADSDAASFQETSAEPLCR